MTVSHTFLVITRTYLAPIGSDWNPVVHMTGPLWDARDSNLSTEKSHWNAHVASGIFWHSTVSHNCISWLTPICPRTEKYRFVLLYVSTLNYSENTHVQLRLHPSSSSKQYFTSSNAAIRSDPFEIKKVTRRMELGIIHNWNIRVWIKFVTHCFLHWYGNLLTLCLPLRNYVRI